MGSVVFVGKRQAAVATNSNLGLVGVDEDSRMTLRATTAIAGNNAVVRPCNGLLVNHLNGGFGLRLEIEVGLLESGAGHGLRTRSLATGPDTDAVGSLIDLNRLVLVDRGGGSLISFGRDSSLELPSGGGEGALAEARTTRKDANYSQLRCCHCKFVNIPYLGNIAFCDKHALFCPLVFGFLQEFVN